MEETWIFATVNAPILGLLAGLVSLPQPGSSVHRKRFAISGLVLVALALAGLLATRFAGDAVAFVTVAAIAIEVAGIALLAACYAPQGARKESTR